MFLNVLFYVFLPNLELNLGCFSALLLVRFRRVYRGHFLLEKRLFKAYLHSSCAICYFLLILPSFPCGRRWVKWLLWLLPVAWADNDKARAANESSALKINIIVIFSVITYDNSPHVISIGLKKSIRRSDGGMIVKSRHLKLSTCLFGNLK